MTLLLLELKKIISSITIWGLVVLCLIFNLINICTNPSSEYAIYIAETSKKTGYILNEAFNLNLEQTPTNEALALYKKRLQEDSRNVVDVFDNYNVSKDAETYISFYGLTGNVAEAMRTKYSHLQEVVDRKAETNESMTLYFASNTFDYHYFLFGIIMRGLVIEGAVIAVLAAFLSVGYERMNRTELCVYTTKTGRNILYTKIAASIITGVLIYMTLSLFTLTTYFCTIHYGNILGSNISSTFNFIIDDVIGIRPFVTWHSFTILSYLFAVIGISVGLVICLSLISLAIGMFIRNTYIGFLVFIIINILVLAWEWKSSGITQYANYIVNLTPMKLIHSQMLWFTDGGSDVLWRNFEIIGLCGSLVVLSILCSIIIKILEKRDIA